MSLCEGGTSCGKWRCHDELNVKQDSVYEKLQMPPCLRAAHVSKYLPVKWAEEKVLTT